MRKNFDKEKAFYLKKELLAFLLMRIDSYQEGEDFRDIVKRYLERFDEKLEHPSKEEVIRLDPELVAH